ncbi:MAG: PRD domain-containing protein [Actinomycetaceae bacterium]|nr:PRD domain-containing protein [Actinomycetaceae bacterium]
MPTLRVERVFNNNAILACRVPQNNADPASTPASGNTQTHPGEEGTTPNGDHNRVIALAKGIGFGRRRGDLVDASGAQIFISQQYATISRLEDLLSNAPAKQVETAGEIMELAHRLLGLKPSASFLLPVLDHLNFAVQRIQQGIEVDFPLAWEVAQLYPQEADFGRQAIALTQEKLGVEFQAQEWSAFALHAITQTLAVGDIGRTVAMTETISAVFSYLEETWGQEISRESVAATRFVTHLRYLFVRITTGQQLPQAPFDIFAALQSSYPQATASALELTKLLEEKLARKLSSGEAGYLALHLTRLQAELP